MISWLLIIELPGFCYCLGRAIDVWKQRRRGQ